MQQFINAAIHGGDEGLEKVSQYVARNNIRAVNTVGRHGHTALIYAANNGHTTIVRAILARPGVDINGIGKITIARVISAIIAGNSLLLHPDTDTALICAARNGHEAVVRELLAMPGIDVNAVTQYNGTALICAARNGHEAVVRALLSTEGIAVSATDQNDDTALICAARIGNEAIVRVLLERLNLENILHMNSMHHTAAQEAVLSGHHSVAALITARIATFLFAAVRNDNEAAVKMLLPRLHLPELLQLNDNRRTAAQEAEQLGYHAIAALIMARITTVPSGVVSNSQPRSSALKEKTVPSRVVLASLTPQERFNEFIEAAKLGGSAGLEKVNQYIAQNNIRAINAIDQYGNTALIYTAINGHEAIVRVLLAQRGIAINAINRFSGNTALILAARYGHEGIVRVLLAQPGIEVNTSSQSNSTALIYAAINNHVTIAMELLARPEIACNTSDQDGDTALICAARNGNEPIVRALLDRMRLEDLLHMNGMHRTAVQEAERSGYYAVAALITARIVALQPRMISHPQSRSSALEAKAISPNAISASPTPQERLNKIHFPANQAPEDFIDLFTGGVMTDPVTVSSGHTYERQYLRQWCMEKLDRRNRTFPCPFSGYPIHEKELNFKSNVILKRQIDEFVTKQEKAVKEAKEQEATEAKERIKEELEKSRPPDASASTPLQAQPNDQEDEKIASPRPAYEERLLPAYDINPPTEKQVQQATKIKEHLSQDVAFVLSGNHAETYKKLESIDQDATVIELQHNGFFLFSSNKKLEKTNPRRIQAYRCKVLVEMINNQLRFQFENSTRSYYSLADACNAVHLPSPFKGQPLKKLKENQGENDVKDSVDTLVQQVDLSGQTSTSSDVKHRGVAAAISITTEEKKQQTSFLQKTPLTSQFFPRSNQQKPAGSPMVSIYALKNTYELICNQLRNNNAIWNHIKSHVENDIAILETARGKSESSSSVPIKLEVIQRLQRNIIEVRRNFGMGNTSDTSKSIISLLEQMLENCDKLKNLQRTETAQSGHAPSISHL